MTRRCMAWLAASAVLAFATSLLAADPPALKPLMAVPDKVVIQDDFAAKKPLEGKRYAPHQGTQWAIEDGVLRGKPSTLEYQKGKSDHQGYEPRLAITASPGEFILQFDVRFLGGEKNPKFPFVEFGHHAARLVWADGGDAALMADGEKVQLATYPGFKIEPGRWYHALAELKGDELVIQFAGGPTVYGKHSAIGHGKAGQGKPVPGVCGNPKGTVELDNVTVWSVKKELQPDWDKERAKLQPAVKPVTLKKAKAK